ncbi:MAG TPA: hypothetical protein VK130_00005 [Steroidobacteraceae bacterium]|nr:hypothetical protein [Steroidobacteraceae bacterium]
MDYRKYAPVALMCAIAAGVGLSDRGVVSELEDAGNITAIAAGLIVALIFYWYRRDARDRGYRTTWGLHTAMVVVTAIALPWYLVRSRAGVAGRSKALGALAALFVLVMACYRLGVGA